MQSQMVVNTLHLLNMAAWLGPESWGASLLPQSIPQQLGKLRCIFLYSYVKRQVLQAATLVVDTPSTGGPLHVSWGFYGSSHAPIVLG